MRNHNDELCFGYFFEQLHYGNTRFAVEGARRFVGKNNSGIVYDCAGNGNALHLSARQLIGFFIEFFLQAYANQRFFGALSSVSLRYAAQRHGKLDVFQNRQVGNEIVALKYESDAMISVGIPIFVPVRFGGNAVDKQVAVRISVQAADNVQQRCFAAAGRTED